MPEMQEKKGKEGTAGNVFVVWRLAVSVSVKCLACVTFAMGYARENTPS
jgi:hypothetical protein